MMFTYHWDRIGVQAVCEKCNQEFLKGWRVGVRWRDTGEETRHYFRCEECSTPPGLKENSKRAFLQK